MKKNTKYYKVTEWNYNIIIFIFVILMVIVPQGIGLLFYYYSNTYYDLVTANIFSVGIGTIFLIFCFMDVKEDEYFVKR